MEKSKPAKRRGEWSARLWFSSRIKEDLTGNGDISDMYISVLGWWKNGCEYPRLEHTWYVGKKTRMALQLRQRDWAREKQAIKLERPDPQGSCRPKGEFWILLLYYFLRYLFFFNWSIIDSCPENPMERGTWQATVHGVARVGHDLVTKPPHNCFTMFC